MSIWALLLTRAELKCKRSRSPLNAADMRLVEHTGDGLPEKHRVSGPTGSMLVASIHLQAPGTAAFRPKSAPISLFRPSVGIAKPLWSVPTRLRPQVSSPPIHILWAPKRFAWILTTRAALVGTRPHKPSLRQTFDPDTVCCLVGPLERQGRDPIASLWTKQATTMPLPSRSSFLGDLTCDLSRASNAFDAPPAIRDKLLIMNPLHAEFEFWPDKGGQASTF